MPASLTSVTVQKACNRYKNLVKDSSLLCLSFASFVCIYLFSTWGRTTDSEMWSEGFLRLCTIEDAGCEYLTNGTQ